MALLEELQNRHSTYIAETWELVGTFKFNLKNKEAPIFRIQVWKDSNGDYHGSPSHYVQLHEAGNPYRPTHSRATSVQEAVKEVFHGLMGLVEDTEGSTWVENKYY